MHAGLKSAYVRLWQSSPLSQFCLCKVLLFAFSLDSFPDMICSLVEFVRCFLNRTGTAYMDLTNQFREQYLTYSLKYLMLVLYWCVWTCQGFYQ